MKNKWYDEWKKKIIQEKINIIMNIYIKELDENEQNIIKQKI